MRINLDISVKFLEIACLQQVGGLNYMAYKFAMTSETNSPVKGLIEYKINPGNNFPNLIPCLFASSSKFTFYTLISSMHTQSTNF